MGESGPVAQENVEKVGTGFRQSAILSRESGVGVFLHKSCCGLPREGGTIYIHSRGSVRSNVAPMIAMFFYE